MKSELVFERISAEELMSIAAAVRLPTRYERDGGRDRIWIRVAERTTLISISNDGDVLSFTDIWEGGKSNASRANDFNLSHGGWGKVLVDRDMDAILVTAVDVEGVTREHVALKLLMWQLYVRNFAEFFGA